MSVFYYEIVKDDKKACKIADDSLALALDRVDDLGEQDFNDAKNLIEQLKENLGSWKEELQAAEIAELDKK